MPRPRSKEAIRSEAAAWVARLHDAHSGADRRRFEEWIAEDPAHQLAYNRAAAAFDAAAALRGSELGRKRNLDAAFRRPRLGVAGGLVTASAVALLLVGAYQLNSGFNPFRPTALVSVMLSTGAQPRKVVLEDGSAVSMAPASEVQIQLTRSEWRAEVRKGRIRLTVKSEKRPFVIVAGNTRMEATEGIFDAEVMSGKGAVSPASSGPLPTSALLDDEGRARDGNQPAARAQQRLEFSGEPLGRVIERINQAHAGPLIEVDGNLANLPVTGVFQQGGSMSVARSLAYAFGLDVVETSTGTLRLTRKK